MNTIPLLAAVAATLFAQVPPMPIQYVTVETKPYTLEVPKGWQVGQETSFGQREIEPSETDKMAKGAALSAMTGPGLGKQSWEQLYRTSLFFITRSYGTKPVTATSFQLTKTKQGFEAASWTMVDADKTPLSRYVVLKSPTGNILALSVKIPANAPRARLEEIFEHMVATAVVK